MKTKLLFVLGTAMWVLFFTGIAAGSYLHRQAQAAALSKNQTQTQVNKLKTQIALVEATLNDSKANTKAACNSLVKLQSELKAYKVNLVVPMPKACQ